jgi:hypothetical protein
MQALLEPGLVVSQLKFVTVILFQMISKLVQNEGSGRLHTAIQINGGDDTFEGVSQDGLSTSPSCLLFVVAQPEIPPQTQASGQVGQLGPGDEKGTGLGELSFGSIRVGEVQGLTDDQFQNRVPEKLERLVVLSRRFSFVSERSVGESPLQNTYPAKPVTQAALQTLEISSAGVRRKAAMRSDSGPEAGQQPGP